MAAAIAVGGCADVEVGPGAGWFSKPVDFFGKSGGFSVEQNTGTFKQRPITANDLVDANGACPAAAAPAPRTAAANRRTAQRVRRLPYPSNRCCSAAGSVSA